jgi:hypothetical protein
MISIGALSLLIPVWSPTLIGLDLPLDTLIGITGLRKKILTCTQETSKEKLERLQMTIVHNDVIRMLSRNLRKTTIHNDDQRVDPGPPHPSACLPGDCLDGQSVGGPYTIPGASMGHHYRYGGIASDSVTNDVTQINRPHKSSMR